MEKLSIIIPVFNEQEGLEKTIKEMDALLEKSEFGRSAEGWHK